MEYPDCRKAAADEACERRPVDECALAAPPERAAPCQSIGPSSAGSSASARRVELAFSDTPASSVDRRHGTIDLIHRRNASFGRRGDCECRCGMAHGFTRTGPPKSRVEKSGKTWPGQDLSGPLSGPGIVAMRRQAFEIFECSQRTRRRAGSLETGWRCGQSTANPSPLNSLLTKENTGNFRKIGP